VAPENAILEAARARLATAAPDDAAKLRRLIGELAEAIARGDVRSSARLDAELTDLLVELP
jgi:DNA-binding GntR family transcriptional regulator